MESKLIKSVESILGPNGRAVKDGYRHNPQQLEYAILAAKGFAREDAKTGKAALNMLQAATGLGKTLGYLVPAMLYTALTGNKMAVSTFTRHLQKQIINQDAVATIGWVKAETKKHLSIAPRFGRKNFVSRHGCETMIDILEGDPKPQGGALEFMYGLARWVEGEISQKHKPGEVRGLLDDYLQEYAGNKLPASISKDLITLNYESSQNDCSLYEAHLDGSKKADVLVVNHALMILHAYRWGSVLDASGRDDRPLSLVVFDEADRIKIAAESVLARDMPLHQLRSITDKVASQFNLKKLNKEMGVLYDQVLRQTPDPDGVGQLQSQSAVGKQLTLVAKSMRRAANKITRGNQIEASGMHDALMYFMDATSTAESLAGAMNEKGNSTMISWSPVRKYPSILMGNPSAGRIMSRMWADPEESSDGKYPARKGFGTVLFTSATMASPGRGMPEAFDNFSRDIGIIRHNDIHRVQTDLLANFQPSKFGELSFVLADPSTPKPTQMDDGADGELLASTNKDWLKYCATMIRAAQKHASHTLVLTLSWRDTELLGQLLQDDGVLTHVKGTRIQGYLEHYSNAKKAVLISPGAWEGVDLPGLVKNLVITRIPFSPPQAAKFKRMKLHMRSLGYDNKRIASIEAANNFLETQIKLEQGIGRALRSPTDKSTIWMADPRFPMPEAFDVSFDDVLMSAPALRRNTALRACIPRRFLDTAYPKSKILLADGTLHTPT